MAKEKEDEKEGKRPFEAWAKGDDIDDSPFLTPREKPPRPLVGPENPGRPLGSD